MTTDWDWHDDWTYARAPPDKTKPVSPRVGKWIVFLQRTQAYDKWPQVLEATEAGHLGPASKIPTLRPKTMMAGRPPSDLPLIVFTYDAEDLADRERVRRALEAMGYMPKQYQSDAQTVAKRAGRQGAQRVLRIHPTPTPAHGYFEEMQRRYPGLMRALREDEGDSDPRKPS